ncbi:acyl-CoA dehydrogenase [Streptomyces agglomeratus]|uniref:acyl-CoA dehydrogenase family protein n=1 Tax=Streptomyces agglomeratus TaxID=285458 RepID=UPI000854EE77|nr:acyl-CoA dehydrogenase family protein [Streptomyces agglomeratus]OEJ39835.1 acyl-CoA dehydrogenase [Streptomyces agglomeratus]OEJ45786.1 acyl-CoA dehydrogenase [Streptomyces agglomeratus]
MDFTPTDEQRAARDLAARIFGDLSAPDRQAAAGTDTDGELWKALCGAGLVEAVGETGLLGLVLLLEEQGRTTAQVPFAATCVYGMLAVAAHGTEEQRARLLPAIGAGTAVVTGAFPATGAIRADASGALSGVAAVVPWLRNATHVLVPDADRELWLVAVADAAVTTEAVETTAPWAAGRLTLRRARGERIGRRSAPDKGPSGSGHGPRPGPGRRTPNGLNPARGGPGAVSGGIEGSEGFGGTGGFGGAYDGVLAVSRVAFAGLQAGVCAGSLARAVEHTSQREQFGQPLSANQGVLLRAADAYMDTEAIRVTAYEAAWRHDAGLPFATHALTAAWWASEAGQRVVHAGQHLHGGTGADLEHPVHRHFLWGRQLDAYLGGGSEVLEELGQLLAGDGPKEGEPV